MTDEYQKALADLLDTMKHFMDFVSDDVTSVEIVVKNPRATVAMPMTLEGLHDTHRALKIASAVMGGLSDEAYDAGLAALDPHVIFYNGIDGEGTSRCSIGAAYKAMIAQILKEIEGDRKRSKMQIKKFVELIGKVAIAASVVPSETEQNAIRIETADAIFYLGEDNFAKNQQFSGFGVCVHEISGDLGDLIGHPILVAEERKELQRGDFPFVFYEFATIKGSVTVGFNTQVDRYYTGEVRLYEILKEIEDGQK